MRNLKRLFAYLTTAVFILLIYYAAFQYLFFDFFVDLCLALRPQKLTKKTGLQLQQ